MNIATKKFLEDEYIAIYTYNQETIIAEKLQTILSRKIANSRMKDYYDLYFFVNSRWQEVNQEILKQAIEATFKKRDTEEDLKNVNKILDNIEKDKSLIELWKDYQDKHGYANEIKYKEIIKAIKFICNEIN